MAGEVQRTSSPWIFHSLNTSETLFHGVFDFAVDGWLQWLAINH